MEIWQQFNDPVYGTVVFKKRRRSLKTVWKDFSKREYLGTLVESFNNIFETVEFSRLNHLKQAGLTYLEFPSAVHTRFAHSWGCLFLADEALNNIDVKKYDPNPRQYKAIPLYNFLDSCEFLDEFLLALLLHDIGHMPFSHLLESSKYFSDITHEEIACQYILGEGDYFDHLKKRVHSHWDGDLPKDVKFLSAVLNQLSRINKGLICALITGNSKFLNSKIKEEHRLAYRIMKHLVSGTLDLDRIDHYQRDVYFTGLRLPSPDPVAIMTNMTVIHDKYHVMEIRLDEMGILQARNLLQAKDTLQKYVFDNPRVLSFHAMLRTAVEIYINTKTDNAKANSKEVKRIKRRISIMTDDELLLELKNCRTTEVQLIVRKIFNRSSYYKVGEFSLPTSYYSHQDDLELLKKSLIEACCAKGFGCASKDVIFSLPQGFYRKHYNDGYWMNMEVLSDKNGMRLDSEHSMYHKEFENYLSPKTHMKPMVVFVEDPNATGVVREYLESKGLRIV